MIILFNASLLHSPSINSSFITVQCVRLFHTEKHVFTAGAKDARFGLVPKPLWNAYILIPGTELRYVWGKVVSKFFDLPYILQDLLFCSLC